MTEHRGQLPADFASLEALPGASVVMAQAFGVPAFPVDTHIHRLAARWGLSNGKSVEQTERDLKPDLRPFAVEEPAFADLLRQEARPGAWA